MNRKHIAFALIGIGIVLIILGWTGVVGTRLEVSGFVFLVVGRILWRVQSRQTSTLQGVMDDTPGMTRRGKIIGYGLIVLWMFLPMIPVVIATVITSYCGCHLDEGSAHPCIVFGRDIGGALYQMGVMGWFGLLTFPTGILALIVFTLAIVSGRSRAG